MKIKRKIIYFLVVIVAALLVLNVLLGLTKKKTASKALSELNKSQIEEIFLSVLYEYGIDQSWILKQNIKSSKFDSLTYQYRIKMPTDIPIPVVLKDLNEAFLGHPVILTSEEKKVHGFTKLNIKTGNYTKLISEFKYYSEISRNFSQIGFLLTDFDEIDESEMQTLFDLAIPLGIVLPLETESQSTAQKIKSHNIEYFIELDNDSDFLDFQLDQDLSLEKVIKNINNIISSFNSPRVFFINETKSGFNPSINGFISEGFRKKERKILSLLKFIKLKGENKSDLNSLLKFHLNKMNYGDSKLFRISIKDWFSIDDELNNFIRKGNKIVFPTKIF